MSNVPGFTGGGNGIDDFYFSEESSDTSSDSEGRIDEVARAALTNESGATATSLSVNQAMSIRRRSRAILMALGQPDKRHIIDLIKSGPISQETQHLAFDWAIINDDSVLCGQLLDINADRCVMDEELRCRLIICGLENEDKELCKKVLKNGHMVFNAIEAIKLAIVFDSRSIFRLLFESNPLSREQRLEMAIEAANAVSGGYDAERLRLLLTNFTLMDEEQERIVRNIDGGDFIDDLRALMAMKEVGVVFTEYAQERLIVCLAACCDDDIMKCRFEGGAISREAMIRLVLEEGSISPETRSEALRYAVTSRHSTIIPLFLRDNERNFIGVDISEALLEAVRLGERDLVEALLANVPSIPSVLRNFARGNVRGEECEAILDLLEQVAVDDSPEVIEETTLSDEWINLKEIESNPLSLLRKITIDGMPRRFCLMESSQVIDLGGITKEVVTTLVDALIDKKLLKTDDILRLPILEKEDSRQILQQFGQFLCQLDHRNQNRTDKVLIGARWSPELFELLKLQEGVSFTEILVSLVEERNNKQQEACLINLLRDPTDKKALVEYSEVYVCGSVESARQEFCKWRNSMEKAVAALRSGLTSKFKEKLQRMDAKDFSYQIQGVEASAEMIIAAFKLQEVPTNRLKKFQERVQWLRDWILGADEKTRKAFLMALTGRNVLGKGTKIAIGWGLRENGAVELHTCFNSIDLPNANELTKEDFLAAVHFAIEQKNYTIA